MLCQLGQNCNNGGCFNMGLSLLDKFPKAPLSALLCWVGMGLIYQWIFLYRKKVPLLEYALVMAVAFSMVFFNQLFALAVGAVVAAAISVIYSSSICSVRKRTERKKVY